ncbi:alpha/beta hydrolase [Deinococcus sp. KSM4-11]|uniref:alpha/beta hydrolase n=1 Tax=Deinococcus sp. KSM4-11 TaxID=2568654 RepID=UPI0010A597AD|nr:alpha/beta hydrolase [Deinococcus sp. KSM4-11]THF84994.1 alpha/beta hydrolase [Deinococcus sp. KSM4-11]
MKRVVLPLLLGAVLVSPAVTASPPSPTAPGSAVPVADGRVSEPLRLPHPLGDAFLYTPTACAPTCPLVVVSHSRGMTADLSLTRPHLTALYARLQGAGYAVLVSNDAGPTTWGAPQALTYLADMHARAVRLFPFDGHTFTFGYSMGGLPALLTAYAGVYPVSGVMLLDAQVSLEDAWRGGNPTFMADIAAAHGLRPGEALPPGRDPARDYPGAGTALPLLVAGSAADSAVSFARNGEVLYAANTSPESRLLHLDGPHLGGTHFGPAFADELLAFLERVRQAQLAPLGHTNL